MSAAHEHTPGCLDIEAIAAYVDGRSDDAGRTVVEAHLAQCSECRELLVAIANSVESMRQDDVAPPLPAPTRRRTWWVVGVAASIVLALMIPVSRLVLGSSDARALAGLVTAVGPARFVEGRLTGGFAWGAVPDATRSGTKTETSPEVDMATATIRIAASKARTEATLRNLGASELARGNLTVAVEALEEATLLAGSSAETWSDLATVYLARSTADGGTVDLPRALDAVNTALRLNPNLAEALFNKGVILQRLRLSTQAIDAFEKYIATDATSAWGREAQSRIAALRKQSAVVGPDRQALRERLFDVLLPAWADARLRQSPDAAAAFLEVTRVATAIEGTESDTLAKEVFDSIAPAERLNSANTVAQLKALQLFGVGRQQYRKEEYEHAAATLQAARDQLRLAGNPLAWAAQTFEAAARVQVPQAAIARDLLGPLAEPTGVTARYPSVRGRAQWILGLIAVREGRPADALRSYTQAHADLDFAGEPRNAEFVLTLVAEQHALAGDPAASWRSRLLSLSESSRSAAWLSAAQAARRAGWLGAVDAFQAQAVKVAAASGEQTGLVDALRERALAVGRSGAAPEASRLLAEARGVTAGHEGAAWDRLRAELSLADAQCRCHDRDVSLRAAETAQQYFTERGLTVRLPTTLLTLAEFRRAANDLSGARRDLEAATTILDQSRAGVRDERLRAALVDETKNVDDALIDLDLAEKRGEAAFARADRLRHDPASSPVVTIADVQSRLGQGRVVAYFSVSNAVITAWAIDEHAWTIERTAVDEATLARTVKAFRATHAPALGRWLYDRTLAPVASRIKPGDALVILADGPIALLPFAALPGRTQTYLVQEHPVLLALSASALVSTPLTRPAAVTSTAFGDPVFSREEFPSLPRLSGARVEANRVAAAYGANGQAVVDEDATDRAFLEALATRDVVHFAGHALANDLVPSRARLLVRETLGQPLTSATLAAQPPMRASLVVLAACRSGAGYLTRAQGPLGFVRALTSRGVSTVVTSISDVSDQVSTNLFGEFHEQYAHGTDPARSLQRAQISAIAAGVSAAKWADFVVVGSLTSVAEDKGASE